MPTRVPVLVVGLGTIARTHLAVLDRRADVVVVGGVDPHPRREADLPTYPDLGAALAVVPEPDVVVVATPTDTHVDLVHELLGRTRAVVLSEKPLAQTSGAAPCSSPPATSASASAWPSRSPRHSRRPPMCRHERDRR